MGIPTHHDKDAYRELNARGDRLVTRIYVTWFLGILVGALGLEPNEFSAAGLSFKLRHPEVIEGIIFVACLGLYIWLFMYSVFVGIQHAMTTRPLLRRSIYVALGKRKSLRRTPPSVKRAKRRARFLYHVWIFMILGVLLLPAAHILAKRGEAVQAALKVIFESKDVQ